MNNPNSATGQTNVEANHNGYELSAEEIQRLKENNLYHLFERFKQQQQKLEQQNRRLEEAFNKIQTDLLAARDAQLNLLPKDLIGVPEIEFSARFHPSQYVSGDIYNIFRLDEQHIGVYHIDISGHGVPAALFSVSLSQLLNTSISSRNLLKEPITVPPFYRINPPDKVVSILNEDNTLERYGIYYTMIYMIINTKTLHIRYIRAGHNPPVVIRENGDLEINKAGGLPVGCDFERDDEVIELNLSPGDRIYLYSDGIIEAMNKKEELFTLERMTHVLQENRHRSLEDGLGKLIDEVKTFTATDAFEDDISIIGIDCTSNVK